MRKLSAEAYELLRKGGPGSRGGQIAGITASGKPKYIDHPSAKPASQSATVGAFMTSNAGTNHKAVSDWHYARANEHEAANRGEVAEQHRRVANLHENAHWHVKIGGGRDGVSDAFAAVKNNPGAGQ